MKVFLIADTHFGHANIIKYCNRPFESVEEMNKTLIKNWNNVVSAKDKVFVLGDFAFKKAMVAETVPKLNGTKYLIRGNHDTASNEFYRGCGFKEVYDYPILIKDFLLLSHAPLQLTETTPYFNYYGHVHNDERYVDTETSKCVSVERIGYAPIKIFETY